MSKLKQVTNSPFLKGEIPKVPTGPHLAWMTELSDAVKGASGEGQVTYGGSTIGGYKAVGGTVTAWFTINPAGQPVTITFPDYTYPGPCHLSNGEVIWPSENNKLSISGLDTEISGWYQYRG